MVMMPGDYPTKSAPGSLQAPGTKGSYANWLHQAQKAAKRGINMKLPQQLNPNVTGGWGGSQSGRYSYSDIAGGGPGLGGSEAGYAAATYGAQAEGLGEQISGLEDILAEADKYGDDINALWGGVEDALKKQAEKARAAIAAGGDPEAIKRGYEAARGEIEKAVDTVTGVYSDLGAAIDEEMQRAPYDERRRLELMKESIAQPLQEHLAKTQDYLQRTGSQGSFMPQSRAMMQEAIKGMVPFVGGQITAAQEARAGMLGQKQNLGQWFGSETAGLRKGKAGLFEREGRALDESSRWKAERLSGIETGLGRGLGDAARGRASGLGSALNAKTGAMASLAGARGAQAEAKGMQRAQAFRPSSSSGLGGGGTRVNFNTSGSLKATGTRGVGSQNVATLGLSRGALQQPGLNSLTKNEILAGMMRKK